MTARPPGAPPAPGPGTPAPGALGRGGPDSREPTSTGLGPPTAAALAYAAWWLTGGLFLAVETHPFVRFHARQALVVFGLISAIGLALWAASLLSVFVSPALFRVTAVVAPLVWVAGAALWAVCVVQAARGRRWRVPFVPARWTADPTSDGPRPARTL